MINLGEDEDALTAFPVTIQNRGPRKFPREASSDRCFGATYRGDDERKRVFPSIKTPGMSPRVIFGAKCFRINQKQNLQPLGYPREVVRQELLRRAGKITPCGKQRC